MSDELDTIVAADNDKYMIRCENLVKIYKTSDVEVVALQGLDLDVERGELMAIVGNSGSGKSRCSICLEDLISLRRETFMWTVRTF